MSKSRTVLVLLNSLGFGGTQLNAIDFAKAVEGRGFRSVLLGPLNTMPEKGPNILEFAKAQGVAVTGYWPASSVVPRRAMALSNFANEVGADIVHACGYSGEPRGAYWGPCFMGRRPLVHTVYEMSVAPEVYRHTSLIIGAGYLLEELTDRPGRTTLISPPVDVQADAPDKTGAGRFRASLGELGSRPLVAVVSRLDLEMKSYPIETAIRAMAFLVDANALLVVVGTGTEETRLRAIASSVNQTVGQTMIHFTGALSDPRQVYAAADIMLGMGSSAARALAFGAPLIVQGEQGTAELFEPQTATALFRRSFWNPHQEADPTVLLAGLVRRLLDEPRRRGELGGFGRRFAIDNFSLSAMAEKLACVYDQSLGEYGRMDWLRDLNRELPLLARNVSRRLSTARLPK